MRKRKELLALALTGAMMVSAVSPALAEAASEGAAEVQTEEAGRAGGADTAVYATSSFGQKFSPFFATVAYDQDIADMVCGAVLAADRGGAIVEHGIEGETREYNGTDYTYYGQGDIEVVQNDDGTVDYNIKIRDDIKFSDGTPATIDDYIFDLYVYCDPTYDGAATLYALPIEGIDEYRSGMDSRMNLILAAGPDGYTQTDAYTQEQYDELWRAFYAGGAAFCQEIVDYCIDNGYNAADDSVAACAANWGYELDEDATTADFFQAMIDNYGYDLSDDGINVETAGTSITDFISAELGEDASLFQAGVSTGDGAANITGIIRNDDYSCTIHMTEYDATAIYNLSISLSPLHYYGDPDQYDYDNNQFGFPKGDLSIVKAVSTKPLGCGPYVFEGYANGVVTLTANPYYFEGEPAIKTLLFQEGSEADYVPGIVNGMYDIASPSISDDTEKAIYDANTDTSDLTGDTITTYLVDYRGYGYIGINADLVNVDDDPSSEASKNLRKGFMTLFSVYRDTVINSYYGDKASVIQYPISNTSWAAPSPADEGYEIAYSDDVDGNPIYDSSMSEEDKYAAAKEAAIGYFKAAGYTFDDATGKFTDFDKVYEIIIPGDGTQDHPAYGVAEAASKALEDIGITLQISDVGGDVWNNALESNTAEMWAAAWQATVDPDMTQVYHSDNAHGAGTNSNHYAIDDEQLDELIVAGRGSADTEERKSIYKQCFDIILDWGCELPLYQRKECVTVSTQRINTETMPKDMTPYWGWNAEINTLEMN